MLIALSSAESCLCVGCTEFIRYATSERSCIRGNVSCRADADLIDGTHLLSAHQHQTRQQTLFVSLSVNDYGSRL